MCSETSEAVGTTWEHAQLEFQNFLKIRITLLHYSWLPSGAVIGRTENAADERRLQTRGQRWHLGNMCKFPAALPAHTPQRISGKSPNTLDLGQRRLESVEVGQGSNFMLGVVERLSLHETCA